MPGPRDTDLDSNASDDDELIATADVLLAQPPDGKELYLLDYPSRSVDAPAVGSERAVEQVRLRLAHRRVEISLSLFPRTEGGDSTASFEFNRPPGNERFGEEGDRQKFVSAQPTEPTANFLAGKYVPPKSVVDGNGYFVLVPIQKVARMRPSFEYLDRVDAERQKEKALVKAERDKEKGTLDSTAGAGGQGADVGKNDQGNEVRVELQFQKRETERVAERRKQSFSTLRKKEEEDPWVAMDFVDQTNPQIEDCHHQVFRTCPVVDCLQPEEDVNAPGATGVSPSRGGRGVKAEDSVAPASRTGTSRQAGGSAVDGRGKSYVDLFYEHAPSANPLSAALSSAGETTGPFDSMRALQQEAPDVAVQKLLTNARIVRFSALRECVAKSTPVDELISLVRKFAFLLRGCWVMNLPRRRHRRHVGSRVPPRIIASRVLVLDMFRHSKVVTWAQIFGETFKDVVAPDDDTVRDVLEEVADHRPGIGWVFSAQARSAGREVSVDIELEEETAWEDRVVEARKILAGSSHANAGAAGGRRRPGGRGTTVRQAQGARERR